MRPQVPDSLDDLWAAALCWRLMGRPERLVRDRWRRRCLVIAVPDCDEQSGPTLRPTCEEAETVPEAYSLTGVGMPRRLARALGDVTPHARDEGASDAG